MNFLHDFIDVRVAEFHYWTSLMQVMIIISLVLLVFQMQAAERMDEASPLGAHGTWSKVLRISYILLALTMLWCVSYGYDRDWQPWPPFVVFLMVWNLNLLAKVVILRQDIRRSEKRNEQISAFANQRNR